MDVNKGRIASKVIFKGVLLLIGVYLMFSGFGSALAGYIVIGLDIKWIAMSDIGSMVIGFGLIVVSFIIDHTIDKTFDRFEEIPAAGKKNDAKK